MLSSYLDSLQITNKFAKRYLLYYIRITKKKNNYKLTNMKTTRKTLDTLLQRLADKTNQAATEKDAIEKGKKFYLYLDHASLYGGYRIVNVKIENGAHYCAFGESSACERISANQMLNKLNTLLNFVYWSDNSTVNL